MIVSFACSDTQKLFDDLRVKRFFAIEKKARIKLALLNAITSLEELTVPPSNRLELLKGNRAGQYSIRINKQWRICFRFAKQNVYEVEIVDYH